MFRVNPGECTGPVRLSFHFSDSECDDPPASSFTPYPHTFAVETVMADYVISQDQCKSGTPLVEFAGENTE